MMVRSFQLIALAALFFVLPAFAHAQSSADLQKEIDAHNAQIQQINKEIAEFEKQLSLTTKEKQTLQNKINTLNIQRNKLLAQVKVTQNQIGSTQKQIVQLSETIADKQASIDKNRAGLAETLRLMNDAERQPLAISVLAATDLAEAWQMVDSLESVQGAVREDIEELAAEKQSLAETKTSAEQKKADLAKQRSALLEQQGSLDATRKAQNELLAQTKSQEATYQQLIAEKKKQQASFEAALYNLKNQLTVDPNDVPSTGKIFRYPIDNVRITQYFGNTPFAASGAYGGKGHNGMDFAVPIGTPLKAVLAGTVAGTGNTDSVRGCYSFGKWVMIKHPNGLSTMYAHLSEISVSTGQAVATGQVIGYSGETGYATGPHLHFGVYVTAVTKIVKLGDATRSSTACSGAVMPVPPTSGYLNPMNYF